jgi:hypothetical protein
LKRPLIVVGLVLAAGGVIFGMCMLTRSRLKVVPGTPIGEALVGGDTLVVMDHVAVGGAKGARPTAEDNRIYALDITTGEHLATRVGDYAKCWAGGPRLICADKYDRVELLDRRTLEVAATAEDLVAAANLAKPSRTYAQTDGGVIVTLTDGRGADIDPETLKVTVLDTVPWQQPRFGEDYCHTRDRVKRGAQSLILESGSRKKLTTDPPPPAESATPRSPAPSFLEGGFLMLEPTLVLHRDVMDGPHAVSRVDEATLAIRWHVALGGKCRTADVVGNVLVLALDDRNHRAAGIDVETGKLLWELEF